MGEITIHLVTPRPMTIYYYFIHGNAFWYNHQEYRVPIKTKMYLIYLRVIKVIKLTEKKIFTRIYIHIKVVTHFL